MPSLSLEPLPTDYTVVISELAREIARSEKAAADFEHRHYNHTREQAVVYCLNHAIDLAKGSLATANANLPDSLTTLTRSILETLFWTRYVTLSTENAREFAEATKNEMKRQARRNLKAGYAHIRSKSTHEDKTDQFLESPFMQNIPKRVLVEKAAKLAGLESLYTSVYAFLSMTSHGRAFNLRLTPPIQDPRYADICATLGGLECIELMASDWIVRRQQTPRETLVRLIGL